MKRKIAKIRYIAKMSFIHPLWTWNWLKSSPLNPANLPRRHVKLVDLYEHYELSLTDLVAKTCAVSCEEVIDILNQFRSITAPEEPENSQILVRCDASLELGQLCYAVVRLTKPEIVVETGVARGVTSYFILRALEENGSGRLYSIDLPTSALGVKEQVGCLVPCSLRSRWNLTFGPSVPEMKKLRSKYQKIDVFLHDSYHSYSNQLAEYLIAHPWLKKRGILISDDVSNDALIEVSKRYGGNLMVTSQIRKHYIGVIVTP